MVSKIPADRRPHLPERQLSASVRDIRQKFEHPLTRRATEPAITPSKDLKDRKVSIAQGQIISGIIKRDIPAGVKAAVEVHRKPDQHLTDHKTNYHFPSLKEYMEVKGDPNALKSETVAFKATNPSDKVPENVAKADTFPLHFLSKARDTLLDKWVGQEAENRVRARHGTGYKLSDKDKEEVESEKKIIKGDLRLMSKMKEQFNEEVYKAQFETNVKNHLYDPSAITAEMQALLEFKDEVPLDVVDTVSAMRAIAKEIFDYHTKLGGKTKIISDEDYSKLYKQLSEIMEQYQKVYKDKGSKEQVLRDAFIVCRDLARVAIYQVYFDKRAFTSSDHGIRHIHHNCDNGHNMHLGMKDDSNERIELLSRITHFYHDIGYSVGAAAANFDVMKDHPFIGAAFIASNKDYFRHYFGEEETKIIEHAILNHAIVAFDTDVKDPYKLVRFTTSNSDACAVTADQKTQAFWVEHPETILQLARLRMFLTIYPDCAKDFKYLADSNIIDKPEVALKDWLVDPNKPKSEVLEKSNFKNEVYYKAYQLFLEVKTELLAIAKKEGLPPAEQKAYEQAIMSNFNSFSGDVVLKQYGAELHKVSAVLNKPEKVVGGEPKYLPHIVIGPSILYAYLESLYGDVAGGNLKKLLSDEYNVDGKKLDKALHEVGKKSSQGLTALESVDCDVASVHVKHLAPHKVTHSHQMQDVVTTLHRMQVSTVPIEFRKILNDYIDIISPQRNVAKPSETPRNAQGVELVELPPNSKAFYRKDLDSQVRNIYQEFVAVPGRLYMLSPDQFQLFIKQMDEINDLIVSGTPDKITDTMKLQLRTLLTAKADWNYIEVKKP